MPSRRVREYIERYLERDLSIEALARVAGLSPHYFADIFRQTTGFSPTSTSPTPAWNGLNNCSPDLALADVAERCGFTSQSQFTTVFRRFMGTTPGKFREDHAIPG
jgi:AraC family transcriptional regulator